MNIFATDFMFLDILRVVPNWSLSYLGIKKLF